jgi:hypothetical protein
LVRVIRTHQLQGPRMSSTIGGNDPAHDLPSDEKDRREKELREQGKEPRRRGKPKEAKKKFDRATEISRPKSRTAQHH